MGERKCKGNNKESDGELFENTIAEEKLLEYGEFILDDNYI